MRKKVLYYASKFNSVAIGLSFLKWVFIGSIVGLFTGAAGALFLKSLEVATSLRIKYTWLLFCLPFGGAIVSFLYIKYGKNSIKGNNLIIEKINDETQELPVRMAVLVFLGTVVTHLFGGSAGREGTGVQIGASIAEGVSRVLKLDKFDTKIILVSGIGSGFASVFGTPLAGTLFGLEMNSIGTINYHALISCFTASMVGNMVTTSLGIHHSHYKILGIPEVNYIILIKIVVCAVIFGLTSRLFSRSIGILKSFFGKKVKSPVLKSAIGGTIVIILVYIFRTREFLGLSIPLMSEAFTSRVHPLTFLGKILFTSVTLGTGFQGGEVTPLFVVGSTLGNALSGFFNMSPSFLASLGLVGVFAGATNAPMASFALGIEMFGAKGALLMFMVCIVSYVFSGHTGIYTSQKVVISKSRLIEIPLNSTLSYLNISKKEKTKDVK
ncbi:voltage-gated chloride channel family protein [Haloimpatiens sp. FM7315]|uniref:voltage-gated chloride channel family protein n=1 Tax=Haloimpatiens sp. FM7315 TaxID=3298609 RepID=UPI003977A63F